MITNIESTSNHMVKQWKKLKEKKERYQTGLYLVEGQTVCEELAAYQKEQIVCFVATESFCRKNSRLLEQAPCVYQVAGHVFSAVSDTKTPQGILAVARIKEAQIETEGKSLALYLDHVADPGNVGTLIRTADAAGADMVVLSPDCADPYNSKTIRAAMGALFHIPVLCEPSPLCYVEKLKKDGFSVLTGSLDASFFYTQADMTEKTVICVGNEAHGVTEDLCRIGVTKVKIPILGRAESLNVSVAGGILLYEAARQRGNGK